MRIRLLLADNDVSYAEHLSRTISAQHADAVDVSVCSTAERLAELLETQRFDAALLGAEMVGGADLRNVHLPLILWAEEEDADEIEREYKKIRKYQRVSSIVAYLLECYARVSLNSGESELKRAKTTVVWSPAGGVGKTSVALAYATKRSLEGKQVLYLCLESFSSSPAYFAETGKSISAVFEMLEAQEGNIKMLIRSIRCSDGGIGYFCKPVNFDDMNILSPENLAALVDACSELAEELVIDMPCICGERERRIFDVADKILLVADSSATAFIKLSQFTSQHNVFTRIRTKTELVANKGAVFENPPLDAVVSLPLIQNTDAQTVYKTLSNYIA